MHGCKMFVSPGISHKRQFATCLAGRQVRISQFAIFVFLLFVGGCGDFIGSDGAADLDNAGKSFSAGDNAAVIRYTDDFLGKYSRSKRADEAYYLRGAAKFNLAKTPPGDQGLYTAAIFDLQQAFASSDNPDLRPKAGFALGNAAYDMGDVVLAERGYRGAILAGAKDPELASEAYYRLGRTLQRQGKWRDADLEFQRLLQSYPASTAARKASPLVNANAWTVQIGSFSKPADAKKAADALSRQFPGARSVPAMDGQPRYLVQAGRYDTYEEAAKALRRIQSTKSDAFVTVTR